MNRLVWHGSRVVRSSSHTGFPSDGNTRNLITYCDNCARGGAAYPSIFFAFAAWFFALATKAPVSVPSENSRAPMS